jgi:Ca-activated chloride channel family protein
MIGVLGAVLIGLALAPTRPAYGQLDPLQATSGQLFLRAGGAAWESAPVLETDVTIRVTGPVARARVVQRFTNPSETWLEGVYVFPLPPDSAVDRMHLRVGERVIEGRIQEREQARRSYARARREGRRASLVEQERPNVFTTRIANLAPGKAVEVAIEYQETLDFRDGGWQLRFPLVVAPRHASGTPEPGSPDAGSPESAPDGVAFPLADPALGPRNPVQLAVDLDAGVPLAEVISSTHVVFVQELGSGRRRVLLRDYADRDFVLRWRPAAGAEPTASLLSDTQDGETHALLLVLPPDDAQPGPALARELVFVIDTSGSMAGASIRQARAALRAALQRLGPGDHFNLIRFSEETESLFDSAVPADATNRAVAERFVAGLEAGGGTEVLPALRRALESDRGIGDVRQVVFLTDGTIADEDALFTAIEAGLGRSRLFTIGIGSAPNGYFLERAARFGRGTHTYVDNPGAVDARVAELLRKLESPVLSEIEVLWNDDVEMWPAQVPDLYAGEPLVVTARLPRFVGDVVIRGRRGGRPWELRLPLEPHPGPRGIGGLWARSKIAALMDELRRGAGAERVRADVVAVALRHHLVSKFTSLVAVDVTPVRPAAEGLVSGAVPANLPAGSDLVSLGGALPRTATPAPLARLVGMLLLLTAGAVALQGRQAR